LPVPRPCPRCHSLHVEEQDQCGSSQRWFDCCACGHRWASRRNHQHRLRAKPIRLALRCHGESWGWEAQILSEGELVIGRRFDLRRLAVQWAEEERKHLERERESDPGYPKPEVLP
jgi:hypothetical protein